MWKVISFMLLFSITSILALAQQTEPYKPDAEFEFKFDYSFKERMLNEKPDYQAQDPDKRQAQWVQTAPTAPQAAPRTQARQGLIRTT